MRAVHVTSLDGPAAVRVQDADVPGTPAQVVIDVHYAGVTFPDVLLTRGQYQIKPPPPFIPGSEVSGIVRSAPDGTTCAPATGSRHSPAWEVSQRWWPRTHEWCSPCPRPSHCHARPACR